PVRGDTVFGDLVHLLGANLDFAGLPAGDQHSCMQRAIHALFGHRDVVIELARHRRPHAVDDPQYLVALAHIGDDHTDGELVVDLVETDALALHLAIDRVDMFGTPGDIGRDALFIERMAQPGYHTHDD